ncbi:leucine-rich repeat protein [Thomasclavelia cocleata]|uniref:leucine-rich repeat protein n=1 Tax=Thomasclavelia cocleata TaxID=69824 RepID=UPI00256EF2E0|nr:leucine-rich repeat protein [Thomasclavelia cocleata]
MEIKEFNLAIENMDLLTFSNDRNILLPEQINLKSGIYEIRKITDLAFCFDKRLESIILPSTVTAILHRAFLGCINLKYIKMLQKFLMKHLKTAKVLSE